MDVALRLLVCVLIDFQNLEDPFPRAAQGYTGDGSKGDGNTRERLDRVRHDTRIHVSECGLDSSKREDRGDDQSARGVEKACQATLRVVGRYVGKMIHVWDGQGEWRMRLRLAPSK